ncbi:hypothetical protein BC828DRAFT_398862 [Blastocladiella britannica]|nr:hypothetical protein BC828DRAFT_398862 [Blastocladiella britannica]
MTSLFMLLAAIIALHMIWSAFHHLNKLQAELLLRAPRMRHAACPNLPLRTGTRLALPAPSNRYGHGIRTRGSPHNPYVRFWMIHDAARTAYLPGAADGPAVIIETESITVDSAMQRSHFGELVYGTVGLGMYSDAVLPAVDGMCSLPVEDSPGLGPDIDCWVGEDAGTGDGNDPRGDQERCDDFD